MKKILLVIGLALMAVQVVKAQKEFAPIGATWYYRGSMSMFGDEGYVKVVSKADTLVNNEVARLLERTFVRYDGVNYKTDDFMIRQASGTVEYFHDGDFRPWYDFNLNVGDTMPIYSEEIYCQEDSSHYGQVVVDSIVLIPVGDTDLKAFYTTPTATSAFGYDVESNRPFIERIGGVFGMYPNDANFCIADVGPQVSSLRCYQDNDLGLSFYNEYTVCDTLITVGVSEEVSYEEALYFDHFNHNLHMDEAFEMSPGMVVSVYDTNGKLWLTESIEKPGCVTSLRHLKSGVYIACLFRGTELIAKVKLLNH